MFEQIINFISKLKEDNKFVTYKTEESIEGNYFELMEEKDNDKESDNDNDDDDELNKVDEEETMEIKKDKDAKDAIKVIIMYVPSTDSFFKYKPQIQVSQIDIASMNENDGIKIKAEIRMPGIINVIPTPGYVIKTNEMSTHNKVFINLLYNKLIGKTTKFDKTSLTHPEIIYYFDYNHVTIQDKQGNNCAVTSCVIDSSYFDPINKAIRKHKSFTKNVKQIFYKHILNTFFTILHYYSYYLRS